MKTRKNIFTSCNLVLFISSLLFASLIGFFSAHLPSQNNHRQQQVFAKQNLDESTCSQLVFEEENETETESGFELQSLVLPFFASFFQFEITTPFYVSAQPLTEKLTNPIYLSVCNFRI